jgi:hypothetical protein
MSKQAIFPIYKGGVGSVRLNGTVYLGPNSNYVLFVEICINFTKNKRNKIQNKKQFVFYKAALYSKTFYFNIEALEILDDCKHQFELKLMIRSEMTSNNFYSSKEEIQGEIIMHLDSYPPLVVGNRTIFSSCTLLR